MQAHRSMCMVWRLPATQCYGMGTHRLKLLSARLEASLDSFKLGKGACCRTMQHCRQAFVVPMLAHVTLASGQREPSARWLLSW